MGFLGKVANKAADAALSEAGLARKPNQKVTPGQAPPQQAQVVAVQQPAQPQYSAQQNVLVAVQQVVAPPVAPFSPYTNGPPPHVLCVAMRRRPPVHETENPPINRNYRCCCKSLLYPPILLFWLIGHVWSTIIYCFACFGCCICPEGASMVAASQLQKSQMYYPQAAEEQILQLRYRSRGCVKYMVSCTRCTYVNCILPCWFLNAWGDEDPYILEDCHNCCKNCC